MMRQLKRKDLGKAVVLRLPLAFVVVLLWSVWLVCGIGNPWKHASGYWYNSDGYPDGQGTQWSSATQQVLAFIFVSVAGSIAIWLAAGRLVKMERLKDII